MRYISLIGFDTHRITKINLIKKKQKLENINYDVNIIKGKLNKHIENYGLYLGGVLVSKEYKFIANSDGDILIHAIIDALAPHLIGKDIGQLFPDNNDMYKNYSSLILLDEMIKKIPVDYNIFSIDIVIVIDVIMIAPIKQKIIESLQKFFPNSKITLKGKRTEGGFKKNYAYCWVSCSVECA